MTLEFGISRRDEKESYLRAVWGDDLIDKFNSWCFELADKEASFLQLKEDCRSDVHYKVSQRMLWRYRQESSMDDLFSYCVNLEQELGLPMDHFKDNVTLRFNNNFEGILHKLYYDPNKSAEMYIADVVKSE